MARPPSSIGEQWHPKLFVYNHHTRQCDEGHITLKLAKAAYEAACDEATKQGIPFHYSVIMINYPAADTGHGSYGMCGGPLDVDIRLGLPSNESNQQ